MAREVHPHTAPASDEPVYEIDSFEMLWEQHKGKIIGGVVAAVVVVAAIFGWMIVTSSQAKAAEVAYASAKNAADYKAVMESYPSSPVAGAAALLLAESLRSEKKYDEAAAMLDRFAQERPGNPFVPLVKIAAATDVALAGKYDDAEKGLQSVAITDSKSFAAPYALLVEAEMKASQGNRDGALQTYRELSKSFPESTATRAAMQAYQAMESLAPEASAPAAQPSPAPEN